jgi:hypothetical protein
MLIKTRDKRVIKTKQLFRHMQGEQIRPWGNCLLFGYFCKLHTEVAQILGYSFPREQFMY